jgi:FPC/CPF motif-containing protein YcgG
MRRVAETIESYEGIRVQDIVFSTEVNEDGDWHSFTVYFHLPEDDAVR